jgi:hypothetical protein
MQKKNTISELDVDFIGGMGPLTKEDEKAISDFIQARKKKQTNKKIRSIRTKTRKSKAD